MKRFIALITLVCFLVSGLGLPVQAQGLALPAPGAMVGLSQPFNPPMLKGIKVDPADPFRFEFILDKGDFESNEGRGTRDEGRIREDEKTREEKSSRVDLSSFRPSFSVPSSSSLVSRPSSLVEESTRLIKYFLASVTVPESDLWVNLSPYEKDRIVPDAFGQTEMGRELLAQDYLLKQLTASVIHPESEVGKDFWDRVYKAAFEKYGTTDVPVDTFNKVWIVPEKAIVYEKAGVAYIVESRLKVMLDSDYAARQQNLRGGPSGEGAQALGRDVLREIVVPVLEEEVNSGENFAVVRQIFSSVILAAWFKKKVRASILANVYADRNKVGGLELADLDPEEVWSRYVEAFKKGTYNYIKEEHDKYTDETIPRKYFSGGLAMALPESALEIGTDAAMGQKLLQNAGKSLVLLASVLQLSGSDLQAELLLTRPALENVSTNLHSAAVWTEVRQIGGERSVERLQMVTGSSGTNKFSAAEIERFKDFAPLIGEVDQVKFDYFSSEVGWKNFFPDAYQLRILLRFFHETELPELREKIALFRTIRLLNSGLIPENERKTLASYLQDAQDRMSFYKEVVAEFPALFDPSSINYSQHYSIRVAPAVSNIRRLGSFHKVKAPGLTASNAYLTQGAQILIRKYWLGVLDVIQRISPVSAEARRRAIWISLNAHVSASFDGGNMTSNGSVGYRLLQFDPEALRGMVAHETGHNVDGWGIMKKRMFIAEFIADIYGLAYAQLDGMSQEMYRRAVSKLEGREKKKLFLERVMAVITREDDPAHQAHHFARQQLNYIREALKDKIDWVEMLLALQTLEEDVNAGKEEKVREFLTRPATDIRDAPQVIEFDSFARELLERYFDRIGQSGPTEWKTKDIKIEDGLFTLRMLAEFKLPADRAMKQPEKQGHAPAPYREREEVRLLKRLLIGNLIVVGLGLTLDQGLKYTLRPAQAPQMPTPTFDELISAPAPALQDPPMVLRTVDRDKESEDLIKAARDLWSDLPFEKRDEIRRQIRSEFFWNVLYEAAYGVWDGEETSAKIGLMLRGKYSGKYDPGFVEIITNAEMSGDRTPFGAQEFAAMMMRIPEDPEQKDRYVAGLRAVYDFFHDSNLMSDKMSAPEFTSLLKMARLLQEQAGEQPDQFAARMAEASSLMRQRMGEDAIAAIGFNNYVDYLGRSLSDPADFGKRLDAIQALEGDQLVQVLNDRDLFHQVTSGLTSEKSKELRAEDPVAFARAVRDLRAAFGSIKTGFLLDDPRMFNNLRVVSDELGSGFEPFVEQIRDRYPWPAEVHEVISDLQDFREEGLSAEQMWERLDEKYGKKDEAMLSRRNAIRGMALAAVSLATGCASVEKFGLGMRRALYVRQASKMQELTPDRLSGEDRESLEKAARFVDLAIEERWAPRELMDRLSGIMSENISGGFKFNNFYASEGKVPVPDENLAFQAFLGQLAKYAYAISADALGAADSQTRAQIVDYVSRRTSIGAIDPRMWGGQIGRWDGDIWINQLRALNMDNVILTATHEFVHMAAKVNDPVMRQLGVGEFSDVRWLMAEALGYVHKYYFISDEEMAFDFMVMRGVSPDVTHRVLRGLPLGAGQETWEQHRQAVAAAVPNNKELPHTYTQGEQLAQYALHFYGPAADFLVLLYGMRNEQLNFAEMELAAAVLKEILSGHTVVGNRAIVEAQILSAVADEKIPLNIRYRDLETKKEEIYDRLSGALGRELKARSDNAMTALIDLLDDVMIQQEDDQLSRIIVSGREFGSLLIPENSSSALALMEIMDNALDHSAPDQKVTVEFGERDRRPLIRITNKGDINYAALRAQAGGQPIKRSASGILYINNEITLDHLSDTDVNPRTDTDILVSAINDHDLPFIFGLSAAKTQWSTGKVGVGLANARLWGRMRGWEVNVESKNGQVAVEMVFTDRLDLAMIVSEAEKTSLWNIVTQSGQVDTLGRQLGISGMLPWERLTVQKFRGSSKAVYVIAAPSGRKAAVRFIGGLSAQDIQAEFEAARQIHRVSDDAPFTGTALVSRDVKTELKAHLQQLSAANGNRPFSMFAVGEYREGTAIGEALSTAPDVKDREILNQLGRSIARIWLGTLAKDVTGQVLGLLDRDFSRRAAENYRVAADGTVFTVDTGAMRHGSINEIRTYLAQLKTYFEPRVSQSAIEAGFVAETYQIITGRGQELKQMFVHQHLAQNRLLSIVPLKVLPSPAAVLDPLTVGLRVPGTDAAMGQFDFEPGDLFETWNELAEVLRLPADDLKLWSGFSGNSDDIPPGTVISIQAPESPLIIGLDYFSERAPAFVELINSVIAKNRFSPSERASIIHSIVDVIGLQIHAKTVRMNNPSRIRDVLTIYLEDKFSPNDAVVSANKKFIRQIEDLFGVGRGAGTINQIFGILMDIERSPANRPIDALTALEFASPTVAPHEFQQLCDRLTEAVETNDLRVAKGDALPIDTTIELFLAEAASSTRLSPAVKTVAEHVLQEIERRSPNSKRMRDESFGDWGAVMTGGEINVKRLEAYFSSGISDAVSAAVNEGDVSKSRSLMADLLSVLLAPKLVTEVVLGSERVTVYGAPMAVEEAGLQLVSAFKNARHGQLKAYALFTVLLNAARNVTEDRRKDFEIAAVEIMDAWLDVEKIRPHELLEKIHRVEPLLGMPLAREYGREIQRWIDRAMTMATEETIQELWKELQEEYVLYHGTSSLLVDRIRQFGLNPAPQHKPWRIEDVKFYQAAHQKVRGYEDPLPNDVSAPVIHVTSNLQQAKVYAGKGPEVIQMMLDRIPEILKENDTTPKLSPEEVSRLKEIDARYRSFMAGHKPVILKIKGKALVNGNDPVFRSEQGLLGQFRESRRRVGEFTVQEFKEMMLLGLKARVSFVATEDIMFSDSAMIDDSGDVPAEDDFETMYHWSAEEREAYLDVRDNFFGPLRDAFNLPSRIKLLPLAEKLESIAVAGEQDVEVLKWFVDEYQAGRVKPSQFKYVIAHELAHIKNGSVEVEDNLELDRENEIKDAVRAVRMLMAQGVSEREIRYEVVPFIEAMNELKKAAAEKGVLWARAELRKEIEQTHDYKAIGEAIIRDIEITPVFKRMVNGFRDRIFASHELLNWRRRHFAKEDKVVILSKDFRGHVRETPVLYLDFTSSGITFPFIAGQSRQVPTVEEEKRLFDEWRASIDRFAEAQDPALREAFKEAARGQQLSLLGHIFGAVVKGLAVNEVQKRLLVAIREVMQPQGYVLVPDKAFVADPKKERIFYFMNEDHAPLFTGMDKVASLEIQVNGKQLYGWSEADRAMNSDAGGSYGKLLVDARSKGYEDLQELAADVWLKIEDGELSPLGGGMTAQVYPMSIPEFVIKISSDSGYESGPEGEIPDVFPEFNFGQAVAFVGNALILKRQSGLEVARILWGTDYTEQRAGFVRLADLPQDSYDMFARELRVLDERGFFWDADLKNLLLSAKRKFNLADIDRRADVSNTFAHMVLPLLSVRTTFGIEFPEDRASRRAGQRIFEKAFRAAIKEGLTLPSSSPALDQIVKVYDLADSWETYLRRNQIEEPVVSDKAMTAAMSGRAAVADLKGGIDLNPAKMDLQTRNDGGEIEFRIDPAMLEKIKSAPGFTPVIIDMQPVKDLRMFLGLEESDAPRLSKSQAGQTSHVTRRTMQNLVFAAT